MLCGAALVACWPHVDGPMLSDRLSFLDVSSINSAAPRGAATAENEAAIDTAAKEFGTAVADQERYGPAKTAVLSAGYGDAGIRLPDGLASFLQGSGKDLPAFDAAMPTVHPRGLFRWPLARNSSSAGFMGGTTRHPSTRCA